MCAFRLNAIQVGATYSADAESGKNVESRDRLLEFYEEKFGDNLEGYVIGQEAHANGSPHYHVYLRFKRKVNYKDPRFMDVDGFHPKIEKGLKSATDWCNYCVKEDETPLIHNVDLKKKIRHAAVAIEVARETGFEKAREYVIDNMPEDYLRMGAQIESNLKRLIPKVNPPLKHELDAFRHQDWTWNKSKSLILWGDSNSGKTSYAKALIGKNYLFIRHIDGLKSFEPGVHEGIIFDDMSFAHWPRESQIHIVDMDDESQINVKHGHVVIPAGTLKIFTCNKGPWSIFDMEDIAINRRVQMVHTPTGSLY